jgi:radical SAM-linked protein
LNAAQPPVTQRLRITFAKTEAMRFTGHLDLHHTWERTFRRARLPLAYSQGFNPHPRLNLASALPLGFTSQDEVIDVWLEQAITPDAVRQALDPALPPGLKVLDIQVIDPRRPALQSELEASDFTITLLEICPDLEQRCQALLQTASLPRVRRDKAYDLRPLILALEALPADEQGHPRLFLRLAAREGATGRPEEVLAALDIPAEATRTHRTCLIFKHPDPAPE